MSSAEVELNSQSTTVFTAADVSSGSGRCSSAAAAPPPADNSPTVVERPQSVNQSQTSTTNASGSAGSSSTSGQLNGAKGQLLSSQATPSTQHQSQNVDEATNAAAATASNKVSVNYHLHITTYHSCRLSTFPFCLGRALNRDQLFTAFFEVLSPACLK